MSEICKGDIGTEINVDMQEDITGATVTKFKVRRPDGAVVEWTAEKDGLENLRYYTLANDLSQIGTYKLQPYVELPAWKGHGAVVEFKVLPTLS
jgi:hypothetical protein